MPIDIYKELGITKSQAIIVNEMIQDGDIDKVLDNHRIRIEKFHFWLLDKRFSDYVECCIKFAFLKAKFIIAGYAVTSAAKLIQLMDSDKPETARKACLDILKGPVLYSNQSEEKAGTDVTNANLPKVSLGNKLLDDKTASTILEKLAHQQPNFN